jgi:hypothetical protein
LGPLVAYKDRIFTFFGKGQHDPLRDVVELIPKGAAERAIPTSIVHDPWRQRIAPALTLGAFATLGSDWQLLSGQAGDRTGIVPDAHGQANVLGVRSTAAWPVVVAREVTVPNMGRPRLRLKIGTDPGAVWKLEVRHGDQVVRSEEITDAKFPDRWKTIEVDLTPAAGQSGWLSLRAQATNGDHVLYIQSAELVF